MSKVYVVTNGDYSDHHVVAVFSCPDEARRIADMGYSGGVEEYDLNAIPSGIYMLVTITRDGRVVSVEAHLEAYGPSEGYISPVDGLLYVWVHGEDEARAIKVANEKRAQWIAEGKRWTAPHGSWGPE